MKLQFHSRLILAVVKVSDSLLSKEILECEFSKKFTTPTFDYYFGANDPVHHIRHFLDKMVSTPAMIHSYA